MLYTKKEIDKFDYVPKVKRLKKFLERNGFNLKNTKGNLRKEKRLEKIRTQYDEYKFSKQNPNPNWSA